MPPQSGQDTRPLRGILTLSHQTVKPAEWSRTRRVACRVYGRPLECCRVRAADIYYKFLKSYSCAQYAENGCWKLEVITRKGCPTAVSVQLDEESHGTQIGTAYGTSGALDPREHAVIEIDADQSHALCIVSPQSRATDRKRRHRDTGVSDHARSVRRED